MDFHLTEAFVVFHMKHETMRHKREPNTHIVVFMSNKFQFRQFHCHFLFRKIDEKVLSISWCDVLMFTGGYYSLMTERKEFVHQNL